MSSPSLVLAKHCAVTRIRLQRNFIEKLTIKTVIDVNVAVMPSKWDS